MEDFGMFYDQLEYFTAIWYIFSVLVCCTKKNLATLYISEKRGWGRCTQCVGQKYSTSIWNSISKSKRANVDDVDSWPDSNQTKQDVTMIYVHLDLAWNIFVRVLAAIRGRFWAGLPDFSWSKHTKMGKKYQMTTNYTKRPYIIPNGLKLFKMVIKYTNIFILRPSKIYPNRDFWFETKPSGNPRFEWPVWKLWKPGRL
jgi:hypothetical protein